MSPTQPPSTEPAATSDAATPSATETPGTAATSPSTAVVIPASCDGIYTRDWAAELDGLLLNPAWTEAEPLWGSNDRGAVTMLEATSDLRCAWVTPSPGDVGIITDVASLTSEQQRSMIEYFGDAGLTCYEENSGTRCVIEERNDEGEWGESHFLRERIWVATRWTNASPDGYTHDIVATIFG